MENRRITEKVSPLYEDSGLFQNIVCNVSVNLIPVMKQNNRGDLIITGLVKNDLEIAVTFAGRRVLEAAPLIAGLEAMLMRQKHVTDVKKGRLPLHIEGAWRPQFVADGSGFETRTFHLIAAKWSVLNPVGPPIVYGQQPVHLQSVEV